MSFLPEHIVEQLDSFCGRTDVIGAFRIMLSKSASQILCITGQDGIGKSWMLYHLLREAERHNALVVFLNKKIRQPLEFMEETAAQLSTQGITLTEFNEQLKVYNQTRREAFKDMQIPFGFYSLAGSVPETRITGSDSIMIDGEEIARDLEDTAVEELAENDAEQDEEESVSEGAFKKQKKGPVEEKALDVKSVSEALGTVDNFGVTYLSIKINDLEKTRLVVHHEEILASYFLADLQKAAIGKRLVLMLDDYEQNRVQLESWLDQIFRNEMGNLPSWIFASASRDEFPSSGWCANAVRYHLRPFSQGEFQDYLRRKRISDTRKSDHLMALTGNIPILLGFLTTDPVTSENNKETYPDKLIDTFFSWNVPEDLRSAFLAAALPRSFNQTILEHATGQTDDRLFEWLKHQSYIEEQDGLYSFHPFMRTRLVQKKFSEDLGGWREIHERLEAYFSSLLPKTAIDESAFWADKNQQRNAREQIYHQLCSSGPKHLPEALNTFLNLLEFDPFLAAGWARTIRQAGTDTLNRGLYNWGQRILLGLLGLYQKSYTAANAMFTALSQYPGLEAGQAAVITRWSAEVHRYLHHYTESLELLDKSIANDSEDPILYALRGEVNRIRGDYEEAVNDFKHALQIKPDCAFSLSRRGEIYREMTLYEDAIKDLNQALELIPDAAGLLVLRADLLRRNKRLPDAMDDLNHALVLRPYLSSALAGRGELYLQNGKNEEALRDFEKALELRPDWCWAIASRGTTYQKMGFNDFAIRDFTRALELNDRYASVIAKRATVYRQIEQYDDALEDLNRAIYLQPNDPTLYALRGELYQHTASYEESLADFNKAIELDPNFVGGIAARGATYRRMAQYAEALLDFSRAAEMDPSLVAVVANQAESYRKLGRYEEALECFTRAIEYKPDYIWAIAGRGETYRRMKRYQDALVDFDRALELDPSNTWILAVRGMTYRLMEQYERALVDFNMAVGFDPNYHGALALRGETHRRLKNIIKAIKDFSRALQIKQDNWTFSGRGEALFQLNHYTEALADFNQAIAIYPRDKWALTWRARTYQKIKRYSKALEDYTQVIDFEPNDDELRMTRALLYQYTGNEGLAYIDFEKAIEIGQAAYEANPMNTSNMLHLALYHLAVNNFDQSDALCEEALAGQITNETLEEVLEHIADFMYVFPTHKRVAMMQQKVMRKRGSPQMTAPSV